MKVIEFLRSKYPGDWKYDLAGYCWEREGFGTARKVATGRDFNGEYTGHWSICLYFEDTTKTPEWLPFSGYSPL